MPVPHNPLSMVSAKTVGPPLAALIVLLAAALLGFPLYVHHEVAKVTGAYAPLYLYAHSPYDTITLEVHYQADAVPSEAALESLVQMLIKYTGKRVEVQKYGDLPPDAIQGRVDGDTVDAIGDGAIQKYGHGSMGWLGGNILVYILYVNASGPLSTGDENETVVGISYRADSFIILKNNIDSEGLEKAVLIHETGHLLGLEHDDDRGCVMAAVLVRKTAWGRVEGEPPTEFCATHQKELADRRQNVFYNAGRVVQDAVPGQSG